MGGGEGWALGGYHADGAYPVLRKQEVQAWSSGVCVLVTPFLYRIVVKQGIV